MKPKNRWLVEVNICVGLRTPIPVLPAFRAYRSFLISESPLKKLAKKAQGELAHLNPGVGFSLRKEPVL